MSYHKDLIELQIYHANYIRYNLSFPIPCTNLKYYERELASNILKQALLALQTFNTFVFLLVEFIVTLFTNTKMYYEIATLVYEKHQNTPS